MPWQNSVIKIFLKRMSVLVFNDTLQDEKVHVPRPKNGDVLIKVHKAGIYNTDFEIIKSDISGFNGVLGHEFVFSGNLIALPGNQ